MQQFLRFAVVGALGFGVDAAVLLAFVAAGATPLFGRVASFLIAATFTFLLNHRYTFNSNEGPSVGRWTKYLTLTALGALLNIGLYQLWITHHDASPLHLLIGTSLGSLAALLVNYSLSRLIVFKAVARAGG